MPKHRLISNDGKKRLAVIATSIKNIASQGSEHAHGQGFNPGGTSARPFFIKQFENGHITECPEIDTVAKLESYVNSRSFDVLVNEPENRIQIQSSPSRTYTLKQPSRMKRGMLWLLLVLAPQDISYAKVNVLFERRVLKGGSNNQYRQHLGMLLSLELLNRLTLKRKGRGTILTNPDASWSFCWIRTSESFHESLLVDDLPGCRKIEIPRLAFVH
jgi:hypothetical protein